MRLIHRHSKPRDKAPRVAITQAEITADLIYPAPARGQRQAASSRRGGR
jgi:hypothetical protein